MPEDFNLKSKGISTINYNDDLSINKASGIWIEGLDIGNNQIDFYIRACWYTAGIKNPNTLATIVRLNNV